MNKINYIQAIKRPFTDFKKFIIGIVLLVIPGVNIITSFIVRGYQLECSKNIKKKKYELPEWKYLKYFVIGILSFLISLIYLLPALIIFFISVGNIVLDVIKTTEPDLQSIIASISSGEITGVIISIILFVITSYIVPIALLEYLNKYKFKDAFKINTVLKKAFTRKYLGVILVIILYYIFVYITFSIIAALIAFIPATLITQVISVILSSIVSFIIGVTGFTLIGEVYPKLK